MKNKNLFPFLAPITFLTLHACGLPKRPAPAENEPKVYNEIKQARWLEGSWYLNEEDMTTVESWRIANDSTMYGLSYTLKGTDTISKETIALEERDGQLTYIPTVNNQNNAQPVPFPKTISTRNNLVFENPAHDFPQKITYEQISTDTLVAEISGNAKGRFKSIQFVMTRLKKNP